ncbi:MAG: hypothetical protein MJ117_10330, partial [Lachnospiraceae bacterium]|nr:hypothetical protein [Lachnospiraceae bacterium]
MTEKELRQLSRYELLDLLEEYSQANAELKLQLENKNEKRKQLYKRFEEELMEEHKKLLMAGREMKRLEEENKELKERLQERE